MRLSSIIKQFEQGYYRHYGKTSLPSHLKALAALKDCRSEYSPVQQPAQSVDLSCPICIQG